MTDMLELLRRLGEAWGSAPPVVAILLRVSLLLLLAVATPLRRTSAAVRHLVWALTLFGSLLIPLGYGLFPAWNWAVLPQHATLPPERAALPSTVVANTPARDVAPRVSPEMSPHPGVREMPEESVASLRPVSAVVAVQASWDWETVLGTLWAVGTCLAMAWLTLAVGHAWRITRRAEPATEAWRQLLQQLCELCGWRRAVEVRQCAHVAVPMTWGLRRPVILVPTAAADWSEETKRSVLLHELGHLRRGDCWVHLLGRLAAAVYWFHPLVWLAVRQLRKTSEQAADDLVLSSDVAPPAYAEHLVGIAAQLRGSSLVELVALPMASPSDLEGRVVAILDGQRNHRSLKRKTGYALLILALLLVIPCALLRLGYTQETKTPGPGPEKQATDAEAQMQIHVLDAETGKSIAEVPIHVRRHSRKQQSLKTDAQGSAIVDFRDAAKLDDFVSLEFHPPGYVPQFHQWLPRQSTKPLPRELTLRFAKGTTIGGRIVDEAGKPIAGVKIEIHMPPTYSELDNFAFALARLESDSEGRWRCADAPADLARCFMNVEHPDYLTNGCGLNESMKQETHVLKLGSGPVVTGQVLDSEGKPVEGAQASVGMDLHSHGDPKAKTDAQGRFTVKNCKPGPSAVTIQAEGYAPQYQRLVVNQENPPVTFRLLPAATLRGRVVDSQGKPIQKAWVVVDTWEGIRTLAFEAKTDAEGRFVWKNAPRETVLMDVLLEGYMNARNTPLVAGDQEQTIVLYPELAIQGAVVDRDSGKPIDSFRVRLGRRFKGRDEFYFDEDLRTGQNGRYAIHIDEPSDALCVKIEAEGYEPALSREFKPTEGLQTCDFQLSRGTTLSGVVLAPDGKPVEKATVLLATRELRGDFKNGQVSSQNRAPTIQTDVQGRFQFLAPKTSYCLFVLAEGGYGQVTSKEFDKSGTITLQAWGRLEGTVQIGAQRAAQMPVAFQPRFPEREMMFYAYHGYEGQADDQGHFLWDRVVPGKGTVSRVMIVSFGRSQMHAPTHLTPVEILPGQTAQAMVGGQGRPVIGRIDTAGRKIEWNWCESGRVTPKKNPDGEAYRSYSFQVQPDGSFRIDDVPAGEYQLQLPITTPPAPDKCGPGDSLGNVWTEFIMPEIPGGRSDEPLDLGTLSAQLDPVVNVGDPVPPVSVYTLDNALVSFGHQKGRVLLLEFWATWCEPCRREFPELNQLYARFRENPRFVMLGLSLDTDGKALRACVKQDGLEWPQARIGRFRGIGDDFGVKNVPRNFVIGPDGRVLAKDVHGPALAEAIEKALTQAATVTLEEPPAPPKLPEPSGVNSDLAVAILDDCDPDYQRASPHQDGLYLLAADGRKLFVRQDLNTCQSSGARHQVVLDPPRQRVYFSEAVTGRLMALDFSGQVLFEEPRSGAHAMAVDPKTGNLWYLEGSIIGEGETIVLDPNGRRIASYPVPGSDIAYDPHDEAFWVVGAQVTKLSRQGEVLFESALSGWNRVSVVTNPRDGSVWVVERNHPDVEKSANTLYLLDHEGRERRKLNLGSQDPFGVACDAATGMAWVVILRKGVLRVPVQGEPLPLLEFPAMAIAQGAESGQIWLTTTKEVLRLDAEGRPQVRYPLGSKSQQSWIGVR